MIKHLFKMVWNRKRTNFLILVEIFFSFLVLFAVLLFAVYYTDNYRRPLGYSYGNVWNIRLERPEPGGEAGRAAAVATVRQMMLALRGFDEIESCAAVYSPPYGSSTMSSVYLVSGRDVRHDVNRATDSLIDTLSLNLTRGRWFSKDDDAATLNPVVINERLARELFGDEDPIGKIIGEPRERGERPDRVIGVITDFRKDGEFARLGYYVFKRINLEDPNSSPPPNLIIRVRPGTTAAFEEKLAAQLQAIAKEWTLEVNTADNMREAALQAYLVPIISVALVAGFLMIMVGLGLTGVLWQNVTQRTREIGLRRAKGATAGKIYAQILGELIVITTFGLAVGAAVVAQFPLLDLLGSISNRVYVAAFVASLLTIYALTIICGLYPSRLATKVRPAEALHYE